MSTYSTEDLLVIITKHRNDYSSRELDAAINELKLRNVDLTNLAIEFERLNTNDITEAKEDKREVKMSIYLKILTLLFPFILSGVFNIIKSSIGIGNSLESTIITFVILILSLVGTYYYIKKSGYIKMAKQFRTWTIISFIFSITLLLLEYILIALR